MESSNVEYGPVESLTWWDEGGIPLPAWRVTVSFGDRETNYWFQTESGAQKFVATRAMG